MLHVPPAGDFPGTGPQGNGIAPSIKSQAQWIDRMKSSGCQPCHQLGDKATRTLPASLGQFPSSVDAWDRRLKSGQAGAYMATIIASFGKPRALAMYADWTDRIAGGEIPSSVPPRPSGLERNVVITNWDFGDPDGYIHDAISTDKRHPTVNANGPIYGAAEVSSDKIAVLDPVRNVASSITVPVRDTDTPFAAPQRSPAPSPYFGDSPIWTGKTNVHNIMLDQAGRLWITSVIRPPDNPAFCKQGSDLLSAKLFPLSSSGRQLSMYDPKTGKFTLIDLCFTTHHLQFADDGDDTLWFSTPGGEVAGWFDTKKFGETGDEKMAQGWTAFVVDTNGNGKRDAVITEPGQAADPGKDQRIRAGFYSVIENPVDHSIWGAVNTFPGAIVRLELGAAPPATVKTEIYEPPVDDPAAPVHGFTPRGIDVDRNGVIWTNLSGSSHLASFDRRKCKGPLNGPAATGKQCPEGWTLYPLPGPQFEGVSASGSAGSTYYVWVDQFNTLGLGENVPIAMGNGSDSLMALLPGAKQFVVLRVPYPMSFFVKAVDGRIDDPAGGWKGRGIWAASGTRAPWHIEGGLGERPKVTKFQIRPSPLAD
ncbi:MAG TPA: carboxypeptidase regulatory-like domain-containing protein [Elusimicrobiota bacterium]|nr:carboxypeptidase regulatory-like domain-containing protein [Elusimicrobiota bacterium]